MNSQVLIVYGTIINYFTILTSRASYQNYNIFVKNCVQFYTTGEIRDINSNTSVSCTVIMYSVHSVQSVDVNATQYMCRGVDMVRAAFPILIVIPQHRTYKEAVPTTCNRWQAMFLCCTTTASHGNTTPVQL